MFALGAITMRSAGCIINDIWDKKIDKQVERVIYYFIFYEINISLS
jgi:4-hydroxybenzoate polyprenyltransferase